jgi:sugar phosphate isomerase/epimerase
MFTGQWADLSLEELAKMMAEFGYDGLELACWGDHMDVFKAAEDLDYCKQQKAILDKNNLQLFAISNHLAGQLVCDLNNDSRSDMFAPADCAGDAEKKRAWAVEAMKATAKAAKNLGVGVKFALEVHPTEIAFDTITAKKALEAVGNREAFGFNFDPSHLHWQMVDPVRFIQEFRDRIYHVHMKDAAIQLDGYTGILASHLNFGKPGRGWDFRSLGRGGVDFEEIIRVLNQIGYQGPLSVEWEDCGMDRLHGAEEACDFVKTIDFTPSNVQFDAAFDK